MSSHAKVGVHSSIGSCVGLFVSNACVDRRMDVSYVNALRYARQHACTVCSLGRMALECTCNGQLALTACSAVSDRMRCV